MKTHGRAVWLLFIVLLAGLLASCTPVSSTALHHGTSTVPRRIASLTLATDEMLADLVPVERLACVTTLADDAELSNVVNVYPAHIPRLRDTAPERIIALCPDLVCVAPYNSADSLKVIERSGLMVYRNECFNTMDEIETAICNLGQYVKEPARAERLVETMRARRKRLAEQLTDVPQRPRVLFWSAGVTAGSRTTIDDIIREAGGLNVALEQGLHGPAAIAPERVIAADPDIILQSQWSAETRASRIENHPLLSKIKAVREKRVIVIEAKYLTTVSHHVVEGAERLARKLHPERFKSP